MRTSLVLAAALAMSGIGIVGCQSDSNGNHPGNSSMTGGGSTDTYGNNPNDRYRGSGNQGVGVGDSAGTAGSVNGATNRTNGYVVGGGSAGLNRTGNDTGTGTGANGTGAGSVDNGGTGTAGTGAGATGATNGNGSTNGAGTGGTSGGK